ncbi:MAG: hypothetical protein ACP5P1_14025 [Acidimicrobiales bacterium]
MAVFMCAHELTLTLKEVCSLGYQGIVQICWIFEASEDGGEGVRIGDPDETGQEQSPQFQPEHNQAGKSGNTDVPALAARPGVAVGRSASRKSGPGRSSRWRPFHTGVLFGALVAVAVTLLIVQNGHSVRINWVAFHFDAPEWMVLFVTAAAGAVVWELIRFGFRRRGGRKTKSDKIDAPPNFGAPPV